MSERFFVDPRDISVKTTRGPVGFHQRLLELIRGAKRQISLASLYLGTGEYEQGLVDELERALRRAPKLRVTLIADHSRGQRATSNGDVTTFTRALARAFPARFQVYLHKMPQLSGLGRFMPSPLDETLAVFHFKAIVIDDVAILTGANLSDEYFHCRQCRAIEVADEHVTALLHQVVSTTAAHSHRVIDGKLERPRRPASEVARAVLALVKQADRSSARSGTWLEPVFQHPHLGVHQERELLGRLFAHPQGDLELHTPYTNFPEDYIDALERRLKAAPSGTTRLVCPSGDSHSFTTGRGPKALVPGAYMHQEAELVARLRAVGPLQVAHYHRPGWVFHSKGVWLTDERETSTIIGSSSFGGRSVGRDFDLSFMLRTDDARVREGLADELALIAQYAPGERKVERVMARVMPWVTPMISSFL